MQTGDILHVEGTTRFLRVDQINGADIEAQPIGCNFDHNANGTGYAIPDRNKPHGARIRGRLHNGQPVFPTLRAHRMDRPHFGVGITW